SGRSRKPVCTQVYRGFESLPLRFFKACDLPQAFSFSAFPPYRQLDVAVDIIPPSTLSENGKTPGFRLADVDSGRLVWGQFGGNVDFALGRWRVAIKAVSATCLGARASTDATSTIALNMKRDDYCHGPGAFQV